MMLASAFVTAQAFAQRSQNTLHNPPRTVLFIAGDVSRPVAIDIKLLRTMPRVQLNVTNGHTHSAESYSGVLLTSLLARAGVPSGKDLHGKALSLYLVAIGSDGYKVVLSLAETDAFLHGSSTVIVADTMNGKPLDATSGPFKLVVSGDKYPARWVRNLVRINVVAAP
jgi:DMSO/TMAO reductase YedYZ molybdopterin-dependent catalytic subunit